ncbi:DUF3164 family protein [Vibrio parahaemolyticus]|uniref:DUF3164 family protein n=1 Tax=Vibrio TaxID=662 RepID=UPI00178288EC|nr:DUF3164 family protein [Vibrio parahaemolyticus]EHJ9983669.1 DUF3164 family protein [Vibrio parahaemolyticus]MBD6983502.1 DUF3164 family protein [Vibrio parahaemolyticus]MBD6986745.1 DUF3164 family protein [Vibrio parahaemolyticus]
MTNPVAPKGMRLNKDGNPVPERIIDPYKIEQDDFVNALIAKAKEQQAQLRAFKELAFGECAAFLELLGEKYNVERGGRKGNVTFTSFDGRRQVIVAMHDNITFGPELQIAKQLIDEYLRGLTEGANDELKVFVNDVFEVDKQGKLNKRRILDLRQYNIDHPLWLEAMEAIADSISIASTKQYIRFREKDEHGKFQNIPLDFAAL